MFKNYILIVAIVMSSFLSFSQQAKLNNANKLFDKIAYASAATVYEELRGSKVDDVSMQSKLAYCYYQIGEVTKAEEVYANVITSEEKTPEDVYNYAQVLKENKKYKESDEWMFVFAQLQPSDSRGKEFQRDASYLTKIESQSPYFEITHLELNTASTDFGGYTIGDKVFFVSNRDEKVAVQKSHAWNDKRFLDLYTATSFDDNSLQDVEMHSNSINTQYHEGPLCFSSDGKTVYFTRNNISKFSNKRDESGIQNLKIYRAKVNSDGKWIQEEEIPLNSKEYSIGHPSISADGKTLYFSSDMPGGFGGADIYKVGIDKYGVFGEPENLGADINTEGQEMFPWINQEGTLFFSSDGHVGLGGLDVFAVLTHRDDSFKSILNVGIPVNSSKDDFGITTGKDSKNGYFSSNRTTGKGDDDIYSFTMLKPIQLKPLVAGIVIDETNQKELIETMVYLFDKDGNKVDSTLSNDKGEYSFPLEENIDYIVTIDPKELEPLEDPALNEMIYLFDKQGNLLDSTLSNNEGNYRFPLEENDNYVVTTNPYDYQDERFIITASDLNPGEEKLGGILVYLYDNDGVLLDSTYTDRYGKYDFILDEDHYAVTTNSAAHINNMVQISSKNLKPGEELIAQDLRLKKDPRISLYALVSDSRTLEPIEGVQFTIIDNRSHVETYLYTSKAGDCILPLVGVELGDSADYEIMMARDGYFTKRVQFKIEFSREGRYDLHKYLDVHMDVAVEKLEDLVEINPINFDLDKSNIRPDAAVELDKIIEVLNKYPKMTIELGSHTDCRASFSYNMKLSDRRAKSSAKYIRSKIVNPSRVYGKGYGELLLLNDCGCEGPVESDCSEEEHEQNRRTEFKVISTGEENVIIKNNSTISF